MIHRVDFSKPVWRYLYQPLYQRVLDYALAHAETEQTIISKFILLLASDLSTHLLVEVDSSGEVLSHCLINVLKTSEVTRTVIIEQLHVIKSSTFIQECLEYAQTLEPTRTLLVSDQKSFRPLAKKYKLEVSKVVLEVTK